MPASERIAPRENIRAEFVAGTARGRGTLLDLSSSGLFVRSPLLPRQGPVTMVLTTDSGTEVLVAGQVRWSSGRTAFRATGFGVRLTAAGSDYGALLESAREASGPVSGPRRPAGRPGSGSPR